MCDWIDYSCQGNNPVGSGNNYNDNDNMKKYKDLLRSGTGQSSQTLIII